MGLMRKERVRKAEVTLRSVLVSTIITLANFLRDSDVTLIRSQVLQTTDKFLEGARPANLKTWKGHKAFYEQCVYGLQIYFPLDCEGQLCHFHKIRTFKEGSSLMSLKVDQG
ncbi:hypothetical protein MKW98_028508 [Papaver atlanticum]|uniref:Uncharacterized protein n=1 Tax=Papaver atlanticum TaxID=357466 RepID=A0AAD4TD91_9MAGN|nr:hypothetical protein MKW98_028508 [Papaver atlanticum]